MPAADVYDVVVDLPAFASLAALASLALLGSLYVSQRRDLQRLRTWMERDPSHPGSDLAASEALLDRAETELEAVLGTPEPAADAEPAPVTSERPALERITMEREALQPHPRWRRLVRQVTQPRVLGIIGILAVVLGLLAIFGSERLLTGQESGHEPKPGAVVPGSVTVAVLNGTSVPGLGAKVADDVTVNGFKLGMVTNSRGQFDQTVVMYEPGEQRAARRVAHDLGVQPVQSIDRQTERLAGNADVVVIAGADRAKP
jgi:LytR cell envelope-related transcriptional attenuator